MVANALDSTVGVLLGNGDGTFQTSVTYGSGGDASTSVAVADVSGDGKPDLLVANLYDNCSNCQGAVDVLINTSLTSTTTALTSSQDPSNFGQSVTFTATVTAQQGFYKGTPTGTVTFTYGSTTLCNAVTLSVVTATCTYSNLPAGTDTVTAAYSGDANFATSSGTLSQTVNKPTTTTTVTSSLNPSSFNQQVTFTATVNGQFGGTPTGTVTFTYGSTTLCNSVTLSGVTATCAYSALPIGTDIVAATYSGDSNFSGSSGSFNQTVNQATTTTTLTSSVNPSEPGQPVTFTATITPQYGGQATGTVMFKDGPTTLGSSGVSGNAASLTTSGLAMGTHYITAIYSGDSNFTGSTSNTVTQVVEGPYGVVSPAAVNFGQVPVGQTSPQQRVTLKNTGNAELVITDISISGNFALPVNKCANGVKPGTHCNVYVTFTPHAVGTESGTLTLTDNAWNSPQTVPLTGTGVNATTTALTSSPNPSTYGEAVTFTAVVTPAPPDGETVSFMKGKKVLGTGTLSGGTASFATSTLKVGTDSVTAVYGGDSNFASSTSNTVKQVVKKAGE
jgi:hypothetical protein